ncbi:endo alpha-1,4 polygalactosaminidase [Iamia sp. SCSIO 61187]|uniref:endo alpha-1,4 polygalactosaminidase n=1 Tax=Iamia sp. SCSIO 61187 TaxID=2722752 RepID=UPI001C637332|nr:endo alpha-1,4 polygalactosaminidase [Iamia sp. SCSIO 61187]QYG91451.1 endo alpha-1,4 polygalactosaminidase [Iamia sp. SCSIO 61187]
MLRTGCLTGSLLLLAACGSDDDGVWQPSPDDRWHVQYTGELDVPDGIDVVDLDMEETPASVIDGLHDDGIRVVCYLSAGSWEPYRSDAAEFPDALLGEAYEGFEDERWLDIRSRALRPLLTARIEAAADKGCDAVDPDNVEGFENDTGFPLTAADQLEFDRWLFAEVHDHGMAVGLKNGRTLAAELVDEVEFQVDEECIALDECDALDVFVDAGKPVWSIEYEGDPDVVCARAAELGFATWIKDLSLSAGGHECPVPEGEGGADGGGR